jgi:hypothetical protein
MKKLICLIITLGVTLLITYPTLAANFRHITIEDTTKYSQDPERCGSDTTCLFDLSQCFAAPGARITPGGNEYVPEYYLPCANQALNAHNLRKANEAISDGNQIEAEYYAVRANKPGSLGDAKGALEVTDQQNIINGILAGQAENCPQTNLKTSCEIDLRKCTNKSNLQDTGKCINTVINQYSAGSTIPLYEPTELNTLKVKDYALCDTTVKNTIQSEDFRQNITLQNQFRNGCYSAVTSCYEKYNNFNTSPQLQSCINSIFSPTGQNRLEATKPQTIVQTPAETCTNGDIIDEGCSRSLPGTYFKEICRNGSYTIENQRDARCTTAPQRVTAPTVSQPGETEVAPPAIPQNVANNTATDQQATQSLTQPIPQSIANTTVLEGTAPKVENKSNDESTVQDRNAAEAEQPVTVKRVTLAGSLLWENGQTYDVTLNIGSGGTLIVLVEYSDGSSKPYHIVFQKPVQNSAQVDTQDIQDNQNGNDDTFQGCLPNKGCGWESWSIAGSKYNSDGECANTKQNPACVENTTSATNNNTDNSPLSCTNTSQYKIFVSCTGCNKANFACQYDASDVQEFEAYPGQCDYLCQNESQPADEALDESE